MFPSIFDWDGSIDRWIFMGVFWIVLVMIGLGLMDAFRRTLSSLKDPHAHHEDHGGHH